MSNCAIPGWGVSPWGLSPWAITLRFASAQADITAAIAGFGLVLANGVTPATSLELFLGYYLFNAMFSLASWTQHVNSNDRPSGNCFANNQPNAGTGPYYLRLLCDGANYYHQLSTTGGLNWRTFCAQAIATPALGAPTQYGFCLGDGVGLVAAVVDGLSFDAVSQVPITAITNSGGNNHFVTAIPHGLTTGDSIAFLGIAFPGVAIPVLVTGPSTFDIAGSPFAYTSGGSLINLSSPSTPAA
jgi:hypothetical protein